MNRLFAAALILALASPVVAQEKKKKQKLPLFADREVIELMLLRQKSVREELKIDMEEAKKIFEFTHKQHEKAMEVHNLPADDQNAKWDELAKEDSEFLHKTFKPEQLKRLRQIAMQTAGLLFISAPMISKEMGITPEQRKEFIKEIREIHNKENPLLEAESREQRNEKLKALREESHEILLRILTPEQKTKWKEMVGEPFKGQLVFEEREKDKK